MGRQHREPQQSTAEQAQLLRLTAAVDQADALIEDALRANAANRQLVDTVLDIRNELRRGRGG